MPLAIVQNGDEPQVRSTAVMLRAAGYDAVMTCGPRLRDELRRAGCDTVLGRDTMERMGYDPMPDVPEATPSDVDRADLFLEIKVRNVPKVLARWPRLDGRVGYLRVNGAQPEICPRGGDEVNLPCPIVTACLWYGTERYRHGRATDADRVAHNQGPPRPVSEQQLRDLAWEAHGNRHRADTPCYVGWPPYPRAAEYLGADRAGATAAGYGPAYALAHYLPSWGFGPVVGPVEALGVDLYGDRAPKGQIPHARVRDLARTALALVHLKSVDCPGWALYEAILSGCPVVTARLLNSRMLAYPLLEHGKTCFEYGAPASLEYGRGDMAYDRCVGDIGDALAALGDRDTNLDVGGSCRDRLLEFMWSADRADDAASFREFCRRWFKW